MEASFLSNVMVAATALEQKKKKMQKDPTEKKKEKILKGFCNSRPYNV